MTAPHPIVIAGVDDSPGGFLAVEHATIEARLHGWDLRLVHVQDVLLDRRAESRLRTLGARLLEQLVDQVHRREPAVAVSTQLDVGSPAAVLIDWSAGAELVVVGNRGRGGFTGLLAGSVSVQVATHARAPVMVVRVPASASGPEWPGYPVLVGVDGSPAAEAAVRFAVQEARLRDVPLVAIHARAEVPAYVGGGPVDPLSSGPLAHADPLLYGLTVRTRTIHADPRTALMDASAHASLVVVGSRGRGGFAGLLLGSVGQALIHHAHCPVVIVRPRVEPAH